MSDITVTEPEAAERRANDDRPSPRRPARRILFRTVILAIAVAAVAAAFAWRRSDQSVAALPPPPLPQVTVSAPLRMEAAPTTGFLGQFSAVDNVELRAQVGGTLVAIAFKDGQIVHKGDLLFVIDPRPYQIRLDQALAQLQTAQAQQALAQAQLWRAQQLRRTGFGTAENVDQRDAEQRSGKAAVETAKAAIRDAELDLEFTHVVAPFTGRIGAHLVSVGSLVSGSRGGTSATTLLATIVSLDPIYLDFDMSEADYLAYQQVHRGVGKPDDVAVSLAGDGHFDRHGALDFIDNAVNRSSGTIHARATVPNADLSITPGQFARLRVATSEAAPVLLLPAAAIVPDQSEEIVMTVAADGTVVPKLVETGGLFRGLRIISGGLLPTDKVVIDGVVRARPQAKVKPVAGAITPDPAGGNS